MTTRNMAILGAAAAVLGCAAYFCNSGRSMKAPSANGKPVLPDFDASEVARIEIGGAKPLVLAAAEQGWKIETMHGYPADIVKIRENIMKLKDLKVGQSMPGRKTDAGTDVALKDASGKTLASAVLGDKHMSKPRESSPYGGGGYPDGRYVKFGEGSALVKETLDAFDGDPKSWCDTRICTVQSSDVKEVSYSCGGEALNLSREGSVWKLEGLGENEELDSSKTYSLGSALSYLDFSEVAGPAAQDPVFGFETGCVYSVALKDGTKYTASIGAEKGGDRYFKVEASFSPAGTNETENARLSKNAADFNAGAGAWIFTVSHYSAEAMCKTRGDLVKAKEISKEEPAADGAAAENKEKENK